MKQRGNYHLLTPYYRNIIMNISKVLKSQKEIVNALRMAKLEISCQTRIIKL